MSDCKITALCNQKGGVTKTTTTANLGVGLAMQGKKVLLVDIDPQADLTTALGWPDSDTLRVTLADVMEKTINDEDFEYYSPILHHGEGVDLMTSYSHTRPDNQKKPYDEIGAMNENIAKGQGTPAEVVRDWMNSDGHRGNILNKDAFAIGVGCYSNGGSFHWVQEFLW